MHACRSTLEDPTTSYGSYLALRTAAAHPDRVGRMVLFGWTVGAPITEVPFAMRFANVPGLGSLMASLPPPRRMIPPLLRAAGLRGALASGRMSAEAVDWFHALMRDTPTMRNELRAGPRLIRPIAGFDPAVVLPASALARVRAPVRWQWGEDDPFGGRATAEPFVAQLPNAELELVPGGHAVWIDDPDRAAAAFSPQTRGQG